MLLMLLGLVLGLIKETAVIFYYRAINRNQAYLGSGLTLGIGLLDAVVIAKLALDRDFMTIAGYLIGEALGTLLILKRSKRQ